MAELIKTARISDPLLAVTQAAMRAAVLCDAGCAPRTAKPHVPNGKRDSLGVGKLETTV